MNLEKLFEMQKKLDERIITEKGLEHKDLLPGLILALQVELGECANEWRGFKFWSNDMEPRTEKLLVEYVDCLHFILSIRNNLIHHQEPTNINYQLHDGDIIWHFNCLFNTISELWNHDEMEDNYGLFIRLFLNLGEKLGFTWEEIEQAYFAKNFINHKRQQNGY